MQENKSTKVISLSFQQRNEVGRPTPDAKGEPSLCSFLPWLQPLNWSIEFMAVAAWLTQVNYLPG